MRALITRRGAGIPVAVAGLACCPSAGYHPTAEQTWSQHGALKSDPAVDVAAGHACKLSRRVKARDHIVALVRDAAAEVRLHAAEVLSGQRVVVECVVARSPQSVACCLPGSSPSCAQGHPHTPRYVKSFWRSSNPPRCCFRRRPQANRRSGEVRRLHVLRRPRRAPAFPAAGRLRQMWMATCTVAGPVHFWRWTRTAITWVLTSEVTTLPPT